MQRIADPFGRNKGKYPDLGISEFASALAGIRTGQYNTPKDIPKSNQETHSDFVENQRDDGGEAAGAEDDRGDTSSPSLAEQVAFKSGSGSGSSQADAEQKARLSAIARGWDDFDDVIKKSSKLWNKSKKYVDSLGKVRDKYLGVNEDRFKRTGEMVEGNKQLIDKNQRRALDLLAGDTRQKMDNTNMTLGLYGATGGSASKLANRALQKEAGKQRAGYLTEFGDQVSEQNQEMRKAEERRNYARTYIDGWLSDQTRQAMEEFNNAVNEINELKKNKDKYEKDDVKSESTGRLNSALQKIQQLNQMAYNWQAQIEANAKEVGMGADQLANENIDITTPAELETPEFNPDVNFAEETQGEDYYDPNKTGERKIKGYDALGNPIYEDEVMV